jgi:hypothetical protein
MCRGVSASFISLDPQRTLSGFCHLLQFLGLHADFYLYAMLIVLKL